MKNTNSIFNHPVLLDIQKDSPDLGFYRDLLEKSQCPYCGFTDFMSVKIEEGPYVRFVSNCLSCNKGWRLSLNREDGSIVVDEYDYMQAIMEGNRHK